MQFIKTPPGKIVLTIGILNCAAIIGFSLWRSFSQVQSVQAYVNGEIIPIRAAIPGELALDSEKVKLSQKIEKGTSIATITSTVENQRVSVLKLEKQELSTGLQNLQQQLSGVKQQIQTRTALLNSFKQQAATQRTLQLEYANQNIQQREAEIAREQAREKVMQRDAQRLAELARVGAETRSRVENKIAEAQQASAGVQEARSRNELAKLNVAATKAGVQLEGTRTLSYPETRILELDVELVDLKQQENNLRKQIQSVQSQLSTTSKELQAQQNRSVLAPTTGTVWSIDSQPQQIVEANQPILQLLNCQNLWVEAFVNETVVNELAIGQEAEINFNGSSKVPWKGQVETIRAGTGRVEVGKYVVEPPPEIARRQVPVRVATVRIKVDWQKNARSDDFCMAGRSVNVRFLRQTSRS